MHEDTLNRLLELLKRTFGTRLASFIVYGSSHTGEFHEGYSNINTMVLVSGVTVKDLSAMGRELKWFLLKGNPAPLIFTNDELGSLKDVFPIEMLDMMEHHTVLYGEDPFRGITIDPRNLGFQCESELKSKLIKLRQSLFVHHSEKKTVALMTGSLSSFIAIFKGVLRLKGRDAPGHKRDIVLATANLAGFDQSPFLKLIGVREGKEKLGKEEVYRTMEMFIEGITKVINFIEKE